MRVQLRLWVSLHHCRAGDRQERQVAPRLSRRQRREGAAKNVDHDLENPEVRAHFRQLVRQLVIALLWIFYARGAIDFRIFQMLVRIESGFTYLLVSR
jgi:hypothetical protein